MPVLVAKSGEQPKKMGGIGTRATGQQVRNLFIYMADQNSVPGITNGSPSISRSDP